MRPYPANISRLVFARFGFALYAVLLSAPADAALMQKLQPSRPTVSVRPAASVADTYFTLGDIADIKGASSNLLAKLGSVPIGRAPLPGCSRTVGTGDISLKLRQAGFDPASVLLTGAKTVLVSSAGGPAGAPSGPSGSPVSPTQSNTIAVHAGDAVNLVYEDGTITITARAVALQNGAVGDLITLQREGAAHSLRGAVVDSETVQLEE